MCLQILIQCGESIDLVATLQAQNQISDHREVVKLWTIWKTAFHSEEKSTDRDLPEAQNPLQAIY